MKKFFVCAIIFTAICIQGMGALEIYRPENHGSMNEIPCSLIITDMEGNDATASIISLTYSWYYDMRSTPHWSHTYFDGCFTGGVVLHLEMKQGTYRISVKTAPEKQLRSTASNTEEWTSNEFIYQVGAPALKVIFISPVANENGFYTGEWHIDYKAPKFYIYTKPYRRQ